MSGRNQLIFLIFFSGYIVGTGVTLLSQYIHKHVEINVKFTHNHPYQIKERYQ